MPATRSSGGGAVWGGVAVATYLLLYLDLLELDETAATCLEVEAAGGGAAGGGGAREERHEATPRHLLVHLEAAL